MNENNNNQHLKNWFDYNRRVIKVGVVCGLVGLACGFVKGANAANKLWMAHNEPYVIYSIKHF